MKKIDLHIHTHFSDGIHSAREVFELAKKAGIETIAIADHNWPHSIKDNVKTAQDFKLDFIEGIEISGLFEGSTVHILGYSKGFDLDKLAKGLERQINGFNERSKQIVNNINNSGVAKISYEQLRKNFKGCIQNFPIQIELGNILHTDPLGPQAKEIYKKYKVPYGDWLMNPTDVVRLIHASNGIAVLAHPALFWNRHGREQFGRLFPLLIKADLDGLEASHSGQSEQEEKEIVELAQKHNLIVTGGSDFHGLAIHPSRQLGLKGLDKTELEKFLEKLGK